MHDVAIALSVIISFLFYEGLGLLTGGMISAGYLALFLNQPLRILSTLILSIIVCISVRLISARTILYNRRRFMLVILIGLLLGWLTDRLLIQLVIIPQDLRIIGYVVPGLIANDMYRQGIPRTLFGIVLSCALIWLILAAAGLL
jgi:poly-gamma-glutamate biosynthesis protein PgsC/CapC